jgi:hypothetical protein
LHQEVFQEIFVELCKNLDLIGGELVGVDEAKLKAVNSKGRNFNNKKKHEYRIKRLEVYITEYLKELQENDDKVYTPHHLLLPPSPKYSSSNNTRENVLEITIHRIACTTHEGLIS